MEAEVDGLRGFLSAPREKILKAGLADAVGHLKATGVSADDEGTFYSLRCVSSPVDGVDQQVLAKIHVVPFETGA